MHWLRRNMRPAASGGEAQAKVDGLVRRGLTEAADAEAERSETASRPIGGTDGEVDTGFNPYDTAGPETLGRHWPQPAAPRNTERSGGTGNPYDTASEHSKKRRTWDDAVIDTAEKR